MKRIFLTIITLLTGHSIYAQLNTFPPNNNVGIGTLTPIATLEINAGPGATSLRTVGPHGSLLIDNVGSGESYYQADTFHQFQGTSGTPILTMLNKGNIGVGTVSPVSKLDISGILHIAYPGILNYSSTGGTYIGWNKSGGGGEANFVNNIAGGSIGGFTFDKTVDGSTFTRLLTIFDNGNVGIGTMFPTEKLAVKGVVRAQEVKVDNENWPDYVFNDNYASLSLTETEAFIKANKHLPEIPSALQVKEEGILVGEMNARLLKKIEELTLHLIRQEKDMLILKKEVQLLKKQKHK